MARFALVLGVAVLLSQVMHYRYPTCSQVSVMQKEEISRVAAVLYRHDLIHRALQQRLEMIIKYTDPPTAEYTCIFLYTIVVV